MLNPREQYSGSGAYSPTKSNGRESPKYQGSSLADSSRRMAPGSMQTPNLSGSYSGLNRSLHSTTGSSPPVGRSYNQSPSTETEDLKERIRNLRQSLDNSQNRMSPTFDSSTSRPAPTSPRASQSPTTRQSSYSRPTFDRSLDRKPSYDPKPRDYDTAPKDYEKEKLRRQVEQQEKQLESMRTQLSTATHQASALEREKTSLQSQLKMLEGRLETAQNQLLEEREAAKSNTVAEAQQEEVNRLRHLLQAADRQRDQFDEEATAATQLMADELVAKDAAITTLQAQLAEVSHSKQQAEDAVNARGAEIQNLTATLDSVRSSYHDGLHARQDDQGNDDNPNLVRTPEEQQAVDIIRSMRSLSEQHAALANMTRSVDAELDAHVQQSQAEFSTLKSYYENQIENLQDQLSRTQAASQTVKQSLEAEIDQLARRASAEQAARQTAESTLASSETRARGLTHQLKEQGIAVAECPADDDDNDDSESGSGIISRTLFGVVLLAATLAFSLGCAEIATATPLLSQGFPVLQKQAESAHAGWQAQGWPVYLEIGLVLAAWAAVSSGTGAARHAKSCALAAALLGVTLLIAVGMIDLWNQSGILSGTVAYCETRAGALQAELGEHIADRQSLGSSLWANVELQAEGAWETAAQNAAAAAEALVDAQRQGLAFARRSGQFRWLEENAYGPGARLAGEYLVPLSAALLLFLTFLPSCF
ncbi:hypothetical protein DIPPA_23640 [Diplonema papillatum]|nr:hypothetical protein DIPPA_23640 [Diplonema papillatum]